jgi:hypothetical protein
VTGVVGAVLAAALFVILRRKLGTSNGPTMAGAPGVEATRWRRLLPATVAGGVMVLMAVGVMLSRSDKVMLMTMNPAEAAAYGSKLYFAERPPNATRALPFFETACRAGEPEGCRGLGTSLSMAYVGDEDFGRAFDALDRACGKGVMAACTKVAHLKYDGSHVKEDKPAARDLWQRACDGGEPDACWWLGNVFTESFGPPEWHDMKLGLAMYQKACAGGAKLGCDSLKAIEAKAQQEAEEAACLTWVASCTIGRFPDGSERVDESQRFSKKSECESARHDFPLPCVCSCRGRR